MTTVPLSRAIYTFKQVLMSAQLDISGTFSVHPASPALLTSKGPHEILANFSRHILLLSVRDIQEASITLLLDLKRDWQSLAHNEVSVFHAVHARTFGV